MNDDDCERFAGAGKRKARGVGRDHVPRGLGGREFSEVERSHFLQSVESLTDGRIAPARLEALLEEASNALLRDGREARLASVKGRLPDKGSRRVALSLAIQVTAADGIIRTSERELILETAEALEIDRNDAANLVRELSR